MKVVSILCSFGHYDFVTTPIERPFVGTTGYTTIWMRGMSKTIGLILKCHDSMHTHLRAVDMTPKVWTVLTNLYEMKTPAWIITMETQLPTISAFVAKMKEIREELVVVARGSLLRTWRYVF